MTTAENNVNNNKQNYVHNVNILTCPYYNQPRWYCLELVWEASRQTTEVPEHNEMELILSMEEANFHLAKFFVPKHFITGRFQLQLHSRVFCSRRDLTWHISVMVSSKTPPASSAPSPSRLTFQARDGSRRSAGLSFTTWRATCTSIGCVFFPLKTKYILYHTTNSNWLMFQAKLDMTWRTCKTEELPSLHLHLTTCVRVVH